MSRLFVIPCYNTDSNGYIERCVGSILETNPTSDILIVDSASPDKSYMNSFIVRRKLTKDGGLKIADVGNKHYDYGAYWFGYENYPAYDDYTFIHDSTQVRANLDKLDKVKSQLVTPFYYFIDTYNPKMALHYDWVIGNLKSIGMNETPDPATCIFGPLFSIKNTVLEHLHERGAHRFLPTSKWEAVYAGEVMWSYMFYNLGIDITKCAYHGKLSDPLADDKIIWKWSGCIEKGRL